AEGSNRRAYFENGQIIWDTNGGTYQVLLYDSFNPDDPIIVRGEYFFGDDQGEGLGQTMPVAPDHEVTVDNFEISTNGLADGPHFLSIRFQDSRGLWSPIQQTVILIKRPVNDAVITHIDYAFDDDIPTRVGVVFEGHVANFAGVVETAGLSEGEHTLSVRFVDSLRRRGPWQRATILVKTPQPDPVIW
ncbi:MAG: hypothetical protein GY869_27835, partial [Planctomycetes bacterium]|nr:hypothetical protein [Planctomycetota bacterium]